MELNDFFTYCWQEYLKKTPSAKHIFDELLALGETVVNDHLAFRTFSHPGITMRDFARYFEDQGMEVRGEYDFTEKKLKALHLEHKENPDSPKVFISELVITELSLEAQELISETLKGLLEGKKLPELIQEQRPWKVTHETYKSLLQESEYAAWLIAYGFFPNHFTVSINHLKQFPEIHPLNDWLQSQGHRLNENGGIVKGSPSNLLEQSSTLADRGLVSFSDGDFEVPTCYYEFAKRYKGKDGKLFQGFHANHADKIFESTHTEPNEDK